MNVSFGEVERLAIQELSKWKASGHVPATWGFAFNGRKASMGLCRYDVCQIQLSRHYVEAAVDIRPILNTIRHEIAHVLAPGAGHGPAWQRAAKMVGCERISTRIGPTDLARPIPHTWELVYYNQECGRREVVQVYHRKPRRQLASLYVVGRPETRGKLRLELVV